MLCDQNGDNGGTHRDSDVTWMNLWWYCFVDVVVDCELVVHARNLGVVNLCLDLNVIGCMED